MSSSSGGSAIRHSGGRLRSSCGTFSRCIPTRRGLGRVDGHQAAVGQELAGHADGRGDVGPAAGHLQRAQGVQRWSARPGSHRTAASGVRYLPGDAVVVLEAGVRLEEAAHHVLGLRLRRSGVLRSPG